MSSNHRDGLPARLSELRGAFEIELDTIELMRASEALLRASLRVRTATLDSSQQVRAAELAARVRGIRAPRPPKAALLTVEAVDPDVGRSPDAGPLRLRAVVSRELAALLAEYEAFADHVDPRRPS